jgi:hypothetical protein
VFTLPPGARTRGTELEPAFTFDTPAPAQVTAAGWKFHLGFVSNDEISIGAQVIDSHRGRRGRARGFGLSLVLVQAGHRVGRMVATGRCGYLGCHGALR